MKISKKCIVCAKDFSFYTGERPNGKYCSRLCSQKGNSFWDKATEGQKRERVKKLFDKKAVKNDGCWGWKGSLSAQGYSVLTINKKTITSNRISWIIYKGDIPDKMLVCHACDNRECSNPEHLFLGTHFDNCHDKMKKGRLRVLRGEEHKNAKLNDDKVIKIRELIKKGVPCLKISKLYGMSSSSIVRIKNGNRWHHINGSD